MVYLIDLWGVSWIYWAYCLKYCLHTLLIFHDKYRMKVKFKLMTISMIHDVNLFQSVMYYIYFYSGGLLTVLEAMLLNKEVQSATMYCLFTVQTLCIWALRFPYSETSLFNCTCKNILGIMGFGGVVNSASKFAKTRHRHFQKSLRL